MVILRCGSIFTFMCRNVMSGIGEGERTSSVKCSV
jgi:hypothetical protein